MDNNEAYKWWMYCEYKCHKSNWFSLLDRITLHIVKTSLSRFSSIFKKFPNIWRIIIGNLLSGRTLIQSSSNIQTQVNSDPKAVNLTITLKDDLHLKIVQNIQKALSGISSVYITDEQEFNWTKKLLEENKCDTDRVIKQVETQITCKFCISASKTIRNKEYDN